MIKKILLSVFLAVIFGLLIMGGINRTLAKASQNEPLNLANAEAQGAEIEWLTKIGSVVSMDDEIWIVSLLDGESLELNGRMISFMTEQGFYVAVNDNLVMNGFLEGTEFEIGRIENETTGQSMTIRDEAGHPLWAGNRSAGK